MSPQRPDLSQSRVELSTREAESQPVEEGCYYSRLLVILAPPKPQRPSAPSTLVIRS